jgi:hypothetical protein
MTWEARQAEIFLGVLGASHTPTRRQRGRRLCRIGLAFTCGFSAILMGKPRLIPHNLKSGVHKASFCDPEINRSGSLQRVAAGTAEKAKR